VSTAAANYLKFVSYISLGIGERGFSPFFRRERTVFRRCLKYDMWEMR